MATGLICVGSVNGMALYASSQASGGAAPQASMTIGPFSSGVSPSATGLICVGGAVAEVVGIQIGAASGEMTLSAQAARSITGSIPVT
jgi:hypothetical protein